MSQSFVSAGNPPLRAGHDIEFALPWVETLTLQSEELDEDHRALLEKLNELLFALSCTDLDRITPALVVLSAEAKAHFAAERELMLAVDYPGRETHIEYHDQLLRNMRQMGFALTSGLISWSPSNALPMLEQWFVPHLTHADRQFACFMNARSAALHAA
jgi:hemerythrin